MLRPAAAQVVLGWAIFLCFSSTTGEEVTISNSAPRRDVSGAIMDCHDGNVLRLDDGNFWMFCMAYGELLYDPVPPQHSPSAALVLP